ncbi:MAG: rRNA (pseudouridine1915-N3)-methyltransferase [Blastocatellia bacterium]|jgi:23S rRNA (pseudouridine1915-N3)-methyltransferase|nr:rRNA (pseudouridine1915-N3)-methyltransferase [Blastocatellia bacterium]
MRIRFIWTGKTKDERMRGLIDEYLKRLARFVRCEVTELRESRAGKDRAGIEKDGRRISDGLHSGALTVLLDEGGREWSSVELAKELQRWEGSGAKEVEIIIGGPSGVSAAVAAQAKVRWSLSRLTLTHEMARVIAIEQIYRAYTIVNGLPYQK